MNLSYGDAATMKLLSYYEKNGEWDVQKVLVWRNDKVYSLGYSFPHVGFEIHLKRQEVHHHV